MKLSRLIGAAAIAVAIVAIPASVDLAAQPATQPAADAHILAVQQAATPSGAVEAYAQGIFAGSNSLELKKAYVGRMVALGVPEMAEAQARDLNYLFPDDGLAWAVTAYASGIHGDIATAISQISNAEQRAAADPFVLHTAGQVMAWYVTRADQSAISESVRQSAETLRHDLQGNSIFAQSYAQAVQIYSQPAATFALASDGAAAANIAAVAAFQPATVLTVPGTIEDYYGPPLPSNGYVSGPTYTPPQVVYQAYRLPDWNVNPWRPGFSGVIILPEGRERHFERFEHHENFSGHREMNHGGGSHWSGGASPARSDGRRH